MSGCQELIHSLVLAPKVVVGVTGFEFDEFGGVVVVIELEVGVDESMISNHMTSLNVAL